MVYYDMIYEWLLNFGEPQEDPEHRGYVPTVMPTYYGKKKTQRVQQEAEGRHQRLLDRRAAAKAMEEEKWCAEEEAEHLRLETAATFNSRIRVHKRCGNTN